MPVLVGTKVSETTEPSTSAPRSDEQLVHDCIGGNPEAWSELIDRYKNLIVSVPIKYGFPRDEAADIFQEVCLNLLSDLPTLRQPRALPKWLLTVTAHKCFHRRKLSNRFVSVEPCDLEVLGGNVPPEALQLLAEAEREQELRQAISRLVPRCRRLVRMLFFETPPRAYNEVAKDLGITVGAIGFMRQRCLDKLRRALQRMEAA
jgi:RNA polymerase sigma factor (sigma-70 family)